MKLATRQVDAFLKSPSVDSVLLYGPDGGLVRERAQQLTRLIAGDLSDPFRVAELSPAMLRDDPARLADEANALSLTGGRRVVRLRDAGDGQSELLKRLLDGPAPAGFLIVEAGELGPRSSLRLLFEGAASGAALPCYRDEGMSLGGLIDSVLGAAKLSAAPDARALLADSLGGDRGVSRAELDKLVLYMAGHGNQVTVDDVLACVGDSTAASLDDVTFALGDGDVAALDRAIDRSLQDGAHPVGVLRSVARHLLRLHQTVSAVAGGADADRLVRGLRPPLHFRLVDRFRRQVSRWRTAELALAIDRLLEAELACKRTGAPAEALMRRACLEIARLVGGRAK